MVTLIDPVCSYDQLQFSPSQSLDQKPSFMITDGVLRSKIDLGHEPVGSRWRIPSDHLPVGCSDGLCHLASFNVLASAYLNKLCAPSRFFRGESSAQK